MSRARRVASEAPLDMGHLTGWGEGMNNPEVTMHDTQQSTGFDALDKAITAASIAISLVMRVPAPLKPIADQVIRSASSVPANLAEGAVQTRPAPPLPHRLRLGQRGRHPPAIACRSWCDRHHPDHHRDPTFRRSQSHHLAPPSSEGLKVKARGNTAHRGAPGNPRGRAFRCGCSGS